jgi:tetratricopeptide (TPR) repeat protein
VFGLLERGRTDEARALLAEHPIEEMPEFIAFFLLSSTAWLATLEGRFDELTALDVEIERIAATLSNPEYAGIRFFNRAFAAELQGDYATAAEALGTAISSSPNSGAGTHSWHGRMLARHGRVAEAQAALETMRESSDRGKRIDMERTHLQAVLAAGERHPDAPGLFAEVIKQAREMELVQSVLLAQYDFASLVGLQDPAARAGAEEALEATRRHGWKGIGGLFEPLFAEGAEVPAPPAVSETTGDAVRAGGSPG